MFMQYFIAHWYFPTLYLLSEGALLIQLTQILTQQVIIRTHVSQNNSWQMDIWHNLSALPVICQILSDKRVELTATGVAILCYDTLLLIFYWNNSICTYTMQLNICYFNWTIISFCFGCMRTVYIQSKGRWHFWKKKEQAKTIYWYIIEKLIKTKRGSKCLFFTLIYLWFGWKQSLLMDLCHELQLVANLITTCYLYLYKFW